MFTAFKSKWLFIQTHFCGLHLVGGDDVSRGRVVYCYEGTWYSLCADGWDEQGNETRVICSSLGYRYGRFNHVYYLMIHLQLVCNRVHSC